MIGKVLEDIKTECDCEWETLAKAMDISISSLRSYRNGSRLPKIEAIEKIYTFCIAQRIKPSTIKDLLKYQKKRINID